MKDFIEIEITRTQKEPFSIQVDREKRRLFIDPNRVESFHENSIHMYSGVFYTLTKESSEKIAEYYSYQNIDVKETVSANESDFLFEMGN
jgi:hypothetical protein